MLVWNGSRESARCNTCASCSHYAATSDRDEGVAGSAGPPQIMPDKQRQPFSRAQPGYQRVLTCACLPGDA